MDDNLRQHHKSLFSVFSLSDGSGHSSIIFSAPTEEMMQGLMTAYIPDTVPAAVVAQIPGNARHSPSFKPTDAG